MWYKFQVNYKTEEWYIIANVFKYKSVNPIMLYWYSGLLGTVGVIIINEDYRAWFLVDWNGVWSALEENGQGVDIK